MTLRAVAQASDVSHNAPYKHFEDRDALLAAVATADLQMLQDTLRGLRESSAAAQTKLMKGIRMMLEFNREHPARYGLVFGNRKIATAGGDVKRVAVGTFGEFAQIVKECQDAKVLPVGPTATVASLLFATMHGLISMEATGGLHSEKGLTDVESALKAWLQLVAPR